VGAFAIDQTLASSDLQLLARAQRGDKESLRAVCRRFHAPVLALALHSSGDWAGAAKSAEPILDQLCRELLSGQLVATDWAMRAAELAANVEPDATGASETSGLEGLGSIPRVVKRKALRQMLPQLPLPELMALLLQYLENRRPEEMVGLVAPNAEEAQRLVVTVHEKLQAMLEAQIVREAAHEL
jgi:hypothetical protein